MIDHVSFVKNCKASGPFEKGQTGRAGRPLQWSQRRKPRRDARINPRVCVKQKEH
jgi:hypothetical protein